MQINRKPGRMALLLAVLLSTNVSRAQAPQAIPYQAAARNNIGVIIPNKTIAIRFSVHDATANGTVVYKETQNAVTNVLGMFIVNIGQGIPVTGTFSGINWGAGPKFMQVELDTTSTGSSYTDMGTQQLMSVPYALNSANGVPVGTVEAYMGTSVPAGWLLCNGAAISRNNFAGLFAIIGTSSGSGDGSTTFNVPDMRGKFLRGADGGTGNDPDAATRTANLPGGNVGNTVGSFQNDALQGHKHRPFDIATQSQNGSINSSPYNYGVPAYGGAITADNVPNTGSPVSDGINGSPRTAMESRPKNVYVNYIIKY